MKPLSTLTLGALLAGGTAFATSTAASAPTAIPASAAQPAQRQSSATHCERLAKNKGLTGEDEKKFVKDCRAGKKSG